jgi:hypothetical protein
LNVPAARDYDGATGVRPLSGSPSHPTTTARGLPPTAIHVASPSGIGSNTVTVAVGSPKSTPKWPNLRSPRSRRSQPARRQGENGVHPDPAPDQPGRIRSMIRSGIRIARTSPFDKLRVAASLRHPAPRIPHLPSCAGNGALAPVGRAHGRYFLKRVGTGSEYVIGSKRLENQRVKLAVLLSPHTPCNIELAICMRIDKAYDKAHDKD